MTFVVPLRYEGEGQFQAVHGHAKRCDKELVIGECLTWEEVKARSMTSHRHFFATVHDAWMNLPEIYASQYPNSETLRKHAMIATGFCTINHFVLASPEEAVAAVPALISMNEYAIVKVSSAVATVWRAESQSVKSMGGKRFQESKIAVLDFISTLIDADANKAGMAA